MFIISHLRKIPDRLQERQPHLSITLVLCTGNILHYTGTFVGFILSVACEKALKKML